MSSSLSITSPANANITDTSTSVSVSWSKCYYRDRLAGRGNYYQVNGIHLSVVLTIAATASGTAVP
jgi:hypothetical protein